MPVKTKITKKMNIQPEPLLTKDMVKIEINDQKTEAVPVRTERAKRGCFFCQNNKEPQFSDSSTLRKFISDRARILPKMRTGTCSKHQRHLTRQIKYARHLALLPFIPSI